MFVLWFIIVATWSQQQTMDAQAAQNLAAAINALAAAAAALPAAPAAAAAPATGPPLTSPYAGDALSLVPFGCPTLP